MHEFQKFLGLLKLPWKTKKYTWLKLEVFFISKNPCRERQAPPPPLIKKSQSVGAYTALWNLEKVPESAVFDRQTHTCACTIARYLPVYKQVGALVLYLAANQQRAYTTMMSLPDVNTLWRVRTRDVTTCSWQDRLEENDVGDAFIILKAYAFLPFCFILQFYQFVDY